MRSRLSFKQRLRTIFLCAMLEVAALSGAVMRPEEIRDLLQTMNQPMIAQVLPQHDENGGDGPPTSNF